MSDEEDFGAFMSQALPIEEGSDNEDLSVPPTSGYQYLRRVKLEAKNCPPVTVANIDISRFKQNRTFCYNDLSNCTPAPSGFAPPITWQKEKIAEFSDLRHNLAKYKAKIEGMKIPKMPKDDDDIGWCQLCFGNKINKPNSEDNSETPEIPDEQAAVEIDGAPPLLSLVCAMTQPVIEQVLNYHINWMEVTGFTHQQGRWFYALLACLEKPLTPPVCSTLRSLARACAAFRATIKSKDDDILVPLNLLICLVARYFDQGDLADV